MRPLYILRLEALPRSRAEVAVIISTGDNFSGLGSPLLSCHLQEGNDSTKLQLN